jgi:hypothetical protein
VARPKQQRETSSNGDPGDDEHREPHEVFRAPDRPGDLTNAVGHDSGIDIHREWLHRGAVGEVERGPSRRLSRDRLHANIRRGDRLGGGNLLQIIVLGFVGLAFEVLAAVFEIPVIGNAVPTPFDSITLWGRIDRGWPELTQGEDLSRYFSPI